MWLTVWNIDPPEPELAGRALIGPRGFEEIHTEDDRLRRVLNDFEEEGIMTWWEPDMEMEEQRKGEIVDGIKRIRVSNTRQAVAALTNNMPPPYYAEEATDAEV